MEKHEGKKSKRFYSIDEAGTFIIKQKIKQKNRSGYFIRIHEYKMYDCLNFDLRSIWIPQLIGFDRHFVTDFDRKLFLRNRLGKFELLTRKGC
jgi:hypothetical protein